MPTTQPLVAPDRAVGIPLDRVIGTSVGLLEIGTDPGQKWTYFQSHRTKTNPRG